MSWSNGSSGGGGWSNGNSGGGGWSGGGGSGDRSWGSSGGNSSGSSWKAEEWKDSAWGGGDDDWSEDSMWSMVETMMESMGKYMENKGKKGDKGKGDGKGKEGKDGLPPPPPDQFGMPPPDQFGMLPPPGGMVIPAPLPSGGFGMPPPPIAPLALGAVPPPSDYSVSNVALPPPPDMGMMPPPSLPPPPPADNGSWNSSNAAFESSSRHALDSINNSGQGGGSRWDKGADDGKGKGGGKGKGKGKQDTRAPCKYFAMGKCKNGSGCPFKHEQPVEQAAGQLERGDQMASGRVRVFEVERAHGFIASEAIHAVCGHEVYVHQSSLAMADAGPGDTVLFFLHWSGKGLPQASSPLIRIASESFALKGTFTQVPGQDYGWIYNDMIKTIFKRDVLVNKAWAELLDDGDVMAFNCSVGKDMQPVFEMGQPCLDDWNPTPGDLSSTRTSPDVQALQVVKGTHGMQAQSADLGPDGKPMGVGRGVYGGQITTIDQEQGVGKIHSEPLMEQFGCEIQFQVSLITNGDKLVVGVGDVCRFELSTQLLPGGIPQASSVTRANQMSYVKPKHIRLHDEGPPQRDRKMQRR